MAYTPNPDREVVNGKAKVSAKELADFQKQYGSDKTLRDLLNADKGLVRRKGPEDIQSSTDAKPSMSRKSGPPTTTQGATYPKDEAPKPRARSLVDQGRDVDIYKDVDKEAVLAAGLGLASLNPAIRVGRAAYTAARPLVGAAVKYMTKKDSPISKDVEPELFTPGMNRPDSLFGEASAREFKKGGAIKKYAKGGKISLNACGVSTHTPGKKNPNF